MNSALLVIDLQCGVLEGCVDAAGVVARTRVLVERARAAGVPVVWVQHEDEDLPHGSPAWQLADGLTPGPTDLRISKTYRDAFADTPLGDHLAAARVRRLVLAGAQSDYCIRTTAQRATADGYAVVLVSDAHTTTDSEFGGVTLTGEQIVAHTNRYFAGLCYPDASTTLATHDAVTF